MPTTPSSDDAPSPSLSAPARKTSPTPARLAPTSTPEQSAAAGEPGRASSSGTTPGPRWPGYAVALGGVLVVIGGRLIAAPLLGDSMPLSMLLVVVAAAATVGGAAPGFLAASLG